MVWRSTAAVITAPIRNARTYLNRRLSESIMLATPRQKPRVTLAIFLAPSRVFDSAARHSPADAIAQFGQRAIMAVRPNLNFTKTISNGLRQCGQESASSPRLINTAQTSPRNRRLWLLLFPNHVLCFPVPSLTCDSERYYRGYAAHAHRRLIGRPPLRTPTPERTPRAAALGRAD